MSEGRILFVYMCTLVFAVSFGFVSVIGSMLSCRVGKLAPVDVPLLVQSNCKNQLKGRRTPAGRLFECF